MQKFYMLYLLYNGFYKAKRRRSTTRKHAALSNYDTALGMTVQRGASAA